MTGLALEAAGFPALTVAELAPALAGYPDLGAVLRVAWHSARPFAASGIVLCAAGPVFVKRHDARVRGVADLREEHRFMAHLRAHRAAVPRVLCTTDGESAVAGAAGVYEVHALGDGEDAYRDAPSWTPARCLGDARAIGAALAQLHAASAGFAAPARRTRLVVAGDWVMGADDPVAALAAWVAADDMLRAALAGRAWREDFARVVMPWWGGAVPQTPCWVHGDFHASNLLWRDNAVCSMLDFGLCNRASAAFDLATAVERNAIGWLDMAAGDAIGRPDLAAALLEGYARVAGDVPAGLRRMLPVVHVEFALSELAYFHGVTRSRRNADLAYDGFLLGHAAWFATKDGARLLDAIGPG